MNTDFRELTKVLIILCLSGTITGCTDQDQPSVAGPEPGSVEFKPMEQNPEQQAAEPPQDQGTDTEQNQPEEPGDSTFAGLHSLSGEELRDGWISLFDGQTMLGWYCATDHDWMAQDGSLVSDGRASMLLSPFSYNDFEFRCDFHLAKGGNSGVFLRSVESVGNPATDAYELNICDTHATHKTGSLVGRHVAEDVPAVEGEWHTYHVRCDGPAITVRLDGKEIVDFTDESADILLSGRIGLQAREGRIAFRNICLRPLHAQDVFNGRDLTGFRTVPGGKSVFAVKDGVIHAENGPGFLETEATFGDFMLQVECNIHDARAIADGRPANSGVFFRAMPGTAAAPSHGYEMQIQNDFTDGDRSKPLDFGSGAIYRRKAARYIVANNNEWMVQTLIAQGNRFATWVNGHQVLDWTDERDPDENPRKGQRLAAGHLSLQGHDPTTDVDFRVIRIRELSPPAE